MMLAGCAPRGQIVIDPSAAGVGTVETVYVASDRKVSGQRLEQPQFFRVDVSVPPDRETGTIQHPGSARPADPHTQFLVAGGGRYADADAFRGAISRDLGARAPDDRDVVLFVHGYNYSFAEGVYRLAQLSHDLRLPGIRTHFSWPSQAEPLGYAGDRDAVLYSRDSLVHMIEDLSRMPGRGRLLLVGHSMGAALLMESLRQLVLSDRRDVLDRIGGVVLLSPDIDINVFRRQAGLIGQLPQPFVIFTSRRDRALRLSALISDEPVRLGNLPDARPLADLDVTLVDIGAFDTGAGHFNVGDSPALIGILTQSESLDEALPQDGGVTENILGSTAIRIERALQVVLSPSY